MVSQGKRTTPTKGGRKWRRRLYLFLTLFLLAAASYLLRNFLLAALARPLVISQPLSEVDYLLVLDGDRRFDEAARLYRDGIAKRFLILEHPPDRLAVTGLLPSGEQLLSRELGLHGIEEFEITLIPAHEGSTSDWGRASGLNGWLQANPGARVAVLCPAFASRFLSYVYSQQLGERAARIVWHPLPDRRHHTFNWWHSGQGVGVVLASYTTLLHAWLIGDGAVAEESHDPADWIARQPGGRARRPGVSLETE